MNTSKLLDYIGWIFLVVTIILLRLGERLLDNVINAKSFLLEFAIYGTILAVAILFGIYKTKPDYYNGGENRASAVLSYFFGIIALFVFGSSYYNLDTAKGNLKILKAFVVDKSLNTLYETPYLTLKIDEREERFQPKREEWNSIKQNDTIFLTVGQGNLGYNYIFEFSANKDIMIDEGTGSR